MRILRRRSNNDVEVIKIALSGDFVDGDSGIIYEKRNEIRICVCDILARCLEKDKRNARKAPVSPYIILGICSPIEIIPLPLDSWPYMYTTESEANNSKKIVKKIDCLSFRDPDMSSYYSPVKKDYKPALDNFYGFDYMEHSREISRNIEELVLKYGFDCILS